MTTFEAKVIQDIPAYRLLALGGVNSEDDPNKGWETIYLKTSELGWIPDLVTSADLEEGEFVSVSIKNSPTWKVEASQNLPAGTLVMCDADGRVKSYTPADGNHIGYTTHSVEAGEVVEIVRKYGQMPTNQVEAAAFNVEEFEQVENTEEKQEVDEKEQEESADNEFPKHTGGGYYELSNGEKVQGKDAAIEAEKELNEVKEGDQ